MVPLSCRSNLAGQYLVDILSQVEDELESALVSMFERTDPMKAWELKKMSNAAWQDAFRSNQKYSRGLSVARTFINIWTGLHRATSALRSQSPYF